MTSSDIARALGRLGGTARAARLPAEERRRIAAAGGRARARSIELARRIVANLDYAQTADALRGTRPVQRLSKFDGPLPDIGKR